MRALCMLYGYVIVYDQGCVCCVWPFGSAFLGVRVRPCLNTWNRGAGGAGYLSHNEAGVAGRATDA